MKHIDVVKRYDTRVLTYPNGDKNIKFYQKKIERKISTIEKDKKS